MSAVKKTSYWLVKQEPSKYPWSQLVKDGSTTWDGVRNFQARKNLRAMQKGDSVFYYHSNDDRAVIGICKIIKEAYPDPTATEGDWSAVDLAPVKPLKNPVTLAQIKETSSLKDIALIRQSRLSVMPLTEKEFETILRLSEKA